MKAKKKGRKRRSSLKTGRSLSEMMEATVAGVESGRDLVTATVLRAEARAVLKDVIRSVSRTDHYWKVGP